jgi:hypothetical protein
MQHPEFTRLTAGIAFAFIAALIVWRRARR